MSMTWHFMDNFLKSLAGRRARSGIGSSGRSIRIATGNVCGRMYVWSSRSAVFTSIMHPPGLQRFALTVDRSASAPRADGLRRAYYGPSHARNAVHVFFDTWRYDNCGVLWHAPYPRVSGGGPGRPVAGLRRGTLAGRSPHPRLRRLGTPGLSRGAAALEPGGEPAAGERRAALPPRAGAGGARPARLGGGRLPGEPDARAPVHDRPRGHRRLGGIAADGGR